MKKERKQKIHHSKNIRLNIYKVFWQKKRNMKRTVLLLCTFLLVAVLAGPAYAALTATPSSLDYGSESQEKASSNNLITLSKTIALKATDTDYTDLTATFNPISGIEPSGVSITGLPSSGNLTIDQEVTITIALTIQDDFSAVDADGEEKRFPLGNVQFQANRSSPNQTGSDQTEVPLSLQIKNAADITKIQFEDDGGSKREVSAGQTIVLKTDTDFTTYVTLRNLFGNSSEYTLTTSTVKVTVVDVDENTVDITDLDPQKEKEKDFSFSSFNDDEVDTYDVDIEVTSTDEGGGKHADVFSFKIRVEARPPEPEDTDGDGVVDPSDSCPNTLSGCSVDNQGCAPDKDNDGVCDALDKVDNTPTTQQNNQQGQNSAVNALNQQQKKTSTTNEEATQPKAEPKKDGGDSSFFPFVMGFIIGALVAGGFFVLLKFI